MENEMSHIRCDGFQFINLTLVVIFIFANVGLTPVSADDENELKDLPDSNGDFWGYKRLAGQIGEEKAYIVASIIEQSSYPELIRAIITIESSWHMRALSNREARGLMQIRMVAAREIKQDITSEELFDPIINVEIGIHIFEQHMNYFDNYHESEHWALTSYNRGRSGTFSLRQNPPETVYSVKVLEYAGSL